jgi:hypothetical protein
MLQNHNQSHGLWIIKAIYTPTLTQPCGEIEKGDEGPKETVAP